MLRGVPTQIDEISLHGAKLLLSLFNYSWSNRNEIYMCELHEITTENCQKLSSNEYN